MKEASEDFLQDGFSSLIGEKMDFLCPGITYFGKLVGVSSTFLKIETPSIYYDRGNPDGDPCLPNAIYLQISTIQTFLVY